MVRWGKAGWGMGHKTGLGVAGRIMGGIAAVWFAATGAAAGDFGCTSTGPYAAEIDQIVRSAMNENGVPGLAIGIIHQGQIIYLQGHGVERSDANAAAQITCRTQFHAASLSKPVVATLALAMAAQGQINLSGAVKNILPQTGSEMPITNLLTHRAGMRDRIRANSRRSDAEKNAYAAQLMAQMPRDARARRFHYSDADYNLIGLALEQHTGHSLDEIARTNIFAPLAMDDTSFQWGQPPHHPIAWPHLGKGGKPARDHPFDIAFAPSSGMQTSARDMLRFMQAYLAQDEAVMPTASYELAVQLQSETQWEGIGQSLVWQIIDRSHGKLLQHGGTDDGFRSLMSIYPGRNAAIIILANGENIDRWKLRARLEQLLAL